MPLIGLIDEEGVPYEWSEIKRGKGQWSDPYPVLMSCYIDRISYADWSVTELLSDPYQLQLRRRTEYFEAPEAFYDSMVGRGVHALFAETDVGGSDVEVYREHRLVSTFKVGNKDVTVGGTADLIIKPLIWDYKTITASKARYLRDGKAKSSMQAYIDQQSMYRYLALKQGIKPITAGRLRFVIRDWRRQESIRAHNNKKIYPKGFVTPIKLKSIKKTEELIVERLKLHERAKKLKTSSLHKIGECDTWNDNLRCQEYCSVSGACWFRKQDKKKKQRKVKKGK